MLAIRKKSKVVDRKVTIEIPENFGDQVEIIILSDIDEKNVDYWSEQEINNIGKSISLVKDIDNEDYSKWWEKYFSLKFTLQIYPVTK